MSTVVLERPQLQERQAYAPVTDGVESPDSLVVLVAGVGVAVGVYTWAYGYSPETTQDRQTLGITGVARTDQGLTVTWTDGVVEPNLSLDEVAARVAGKRSVLA